MAYPGFDPSQMYAGNNAQMDPSAVNKWLDPSMQFTMDQGMRALGSSASAGGQTFAGNTLKDILGYSQGLASQGYNDAYNKAAGQQQFAQQGSQFDRNLQNQMSMSDNALQAAQQQANANREIAANQLAWNRESGDRAFNYQAQLNDQTIPWQQQYQMAQLGLQGTGQQSNLAATLAGLLSNNLLTQGQIQGSGTMGQNNSITSALSSILSGLYNNNTYNSLFGK
jgi:hypothetical protein